MDGSISGTQSVASAANGGIEACLGASPSDVRALFQRLLPAEFVDRLQQQEGLRQNNRVYTASVVMWLMISQRLHANGTLESGVLELVRGLPDSFWPNPCKRLRVGPEGQRPILSSNTGSYNNARQALLVTIVEQCCDRAAEELLEQAAAATATAGRRAFFLDGTTLRTPHTEALCQAYPPASNQKGASHWPLIRMVVAHDLDTGLALRPEWGSQAVSEQRLLEQAIDRLPSEAVVVGDANLGVFSVAYAATQRQHPVLLRLTLARAQRIAPEPLRDGIDRPMCWKPTSRDRHSHPDLAADACVQGRLVVRRVQPSDGKAAFLLALFTTLEQAADEEFQLYGQRWNIETDLRYLKRTLQLEQLTSTSPQMVAKEIPMALLTYNLVRALMAVAAQQTGLTPRSFSFTRVRRVIDAFAPLIANAQDEQEGRRLFDQIMYYVRQAKLSKRQRKSSPRAVWGRPQPYPKRKA